MFTKRKRKKRKKNISSSACFNSKSQWTFHCKYVNMEFSLGNTKKKNTINTDSMGCLFPCFNPPKHFCFYYFILFTFWSLFSFFFSFVQFWIILSNAIPQSLLNRDLVIVWQCVCLYY